MPRVCLWYRGTLLHEEIERGGWGELESGESLREGAQSGKKEFGKSYHKQKRGEIGLPRAEWVCCEL